MRPVLAELAAASVAALLTGELSRRAVRARPRSASASASASESLAGQDRPAGRWWRSNYAGAPVTLLEGPAVLAGALGGLTLRSLARPDRRRESVATALVLLGSGLVGGYDDLYGSTQAKGFSGHLRALRRGELTSGMIKIGGVGLAGLAGAVINAAGPGGRRSPIDLMINTGLSATSANLVNLCDLRPGRAIKAATLLGFGALGHGAGPVLAAGLGGLPNDLAGRSMLGDCGANALGAGVATAAAGWPRPVRVAALIGLLGLNLASEKYSFTRVIEANPVLRRLDRLGRPLPVAGPGDRPAR